MAVTNACVRGRTTDADISFRPTLDAQLSDIVELQSWRRLPRAAKAVRPNARESHRLSGVGAFAHELATDCPAPAIPSSAGRTSAAGHHRGSNQARQARTDRGSRDELTFQEKTQFPRRSVALRSCSKSSEKMTKEWA